MKGDQMNWLLIVIRGPCVYSIRFHNENHAEEAAVFLLNSGCITLLLYDPENA